jgi:hypothetical protein
LHLKECEFRFNNRGKGIVEFKRDMFRLLGNCPGAVRKNVPDKMLNMKIEKIETSQAPKQMRRLLWPKESFIL